MAQGRRPGGGGGDDESIRCVGGGCWGCRGCRRRGGGWGRGFWRLGIAAVGSESGSCGGRRFSAGCADECGRDAAGFDRVAGAIQELVERVDGRGADGGGAEAEAGLGEALEGVECLADVRGIGPGDEVEEGDVEGLGDLGEAEAVVEEGGEEPGVAMGWGGGHGDKIRYLWGESRGGGRMTTKCAHKRGKWETDFRSGVFDCCGGGVCRTSRQWREETGTRHAVWMSRGGERS